jgi:hypothetical protein
MTEPTKEEQDRIIKGPSVWRKIANNWNNLSRFWSASERRLQRELDQLHKDLGEILEKDKP